MSGVPPAEGDPRPGSGRRRWLGVAVGLFLVVPLVIGAALLATWALGPEALITTLFAGLGVGMFATYWLGDKDIFLGCVLGVAGLLLVSGGACVYVLSQLEF